MWLRRNATLLWTMLALCCWFPLCAAGAAAPALKLTATNVSMGDRGSGTSRFTLTSLNGFTGTVNVNCPNGITSSLEEVLPVCTPGSQVFKLPANGSVSGTVRLIPPWTIMGSVRRDLPTSPWRTPLGMPAVAGGLMAACLMGSKLRRGWRRILSVIALCAVGFAGLGAVTGCIGHGGLAMTPGSYTYTIIGENLLGQMQTYADFKVTITQ